MAAPEIYRICIEGHLNPDWAEWFDGITIAHDADGQTTITGPVCDQAALYGILTKLRDMGLILRSVNPVGSEDQSYDG